jgi:addiction module HigA family antidote
VLLQVRIRSQAETPRLNEVVRGKRGVTVDTAVRLARLLDTSPQFRMNLQVSCDLYHAARALERAKT